MSVSPVSSQPKPDAANRAGGGETPKESGRRLVRYLLFLSVMVAALCFWRSPLALRDWPGVLLLTGLAVVVGLLPVRLPGRLIASSPTVPIIFALVGLYGATAALVAIVPATFVGVAIFLPRERRLRLREYLHNQAIQIVSVGLSALLYVTLEAWRFPHTGVRPGETPEWRAWLALPVSAFLSFTLNAILTTLVMSRFYRQRWDLLWHDNFRWMLSSAFVMSPVGFLTAVLFAQNWWLGVGFIILPVYTLRMAVVTHERTMAAYKHGVDLLGRIMQEAHPYTHGHLHRVARWAKKIAEEMSLPAGSMQHIEDAAILHDIGKVAVDDRVLNKVGKLTDDDWAMIRRHPVTGADLVGQMSVLGRVGHWIRHHHERPDGKGYPDGLQGDEIPLESCIISVVDAFDAMVGGPAKEDQRPYRQPMTEGAAIEELRRHAGTQFHAQVVEVFITVLAREKELEATGRHVAPPSDGADDSLWVTPPHVAGVLSASVGG